MSDKPPDAWREWLRTFRERFIAVQGWTEKDAKLRIHDAWAVVRDGRVHVLAEDSQRPASAVPVFLMLTPGGWKLPIRIVERLTGLVEKAMSSDRSPRDIVLGLLDLANHADGQDDSDEIKRKRHKAAFWTLQLLDACEDEALSGVVEHDVFWQAILSALEAGRWLTILELYRDLQLLADLIKAQSFQSGRSPDELTQCLEVSFLELLRAQRGRLRDRAAHQGEAHQSSMAAQQGWKAPSAYLRTLTLGVDREPDPNRASRSHHLNKKEPGFLPAQTSQNARQIYKSTSPKRQALA